jgi:hypothetical protein
MSIDSTDDLRPASDTEACRVALQREGWRAGETALTDCGGKVTWIVTGQKGDRRIRAQGSTRHVAWREATNLVLMGGDGYAAPLREVRVGPRVTPREDSRGTQEYFTSPRTAT